MRWLLDHLGVLPDPASGESGAFNFSLLRKFWNPLGEGGHNSWGLLSGACVGAEYLIQRGDSAKLGFGLELRVTSQ